MRWVVATALLAACGTPAAKPESPPPTSAPAPLDTAIVATAAAAPVAPAPTWDGTGCPPVDAIRPAEGRLVPAGVRLPYQEPIPPEGPLPASELARYEIELVPEVQWIYTEGGAPCRGRVDGYRVVIEGADQPDGAERDTTSYTVYATIAGCEAVAGVRPAWAVAGPDELASSCALVGATTDEESPFDPDSDLRLKKKPRPVPKPYRALIPKGRCRAPCGTDWTITELATTPPVAQVTISRVSVDRREESECQWEVLSRSGTFVHDGKTPGELSGMPAQQLVGAFVDGGKAKVLLYLDPGAWDARLVDDPRRWAGGRYYESDSGFCATLWCCCGC